MLAANLEDRLLLWSVLASEGASLLPSRAGFEDFHTFVANALHGHASVDYALVLAAVHQRWPEHVRLTALCCAWHALNVHDDAPSINLALVAADADEYEPQAIRILLAALRRRLLLETGSADDWAQYLIPLRFILTYLSVHPEESSLRASLVNAMSIESAGLNGVRLLALLTIDVLRERSPMLDIPPKRVAASEEEFEAFLDPAIAWMRQQPAIELGSMRFPTELMHSNPSGLIAMASLFVRAAARQPPTSEHLLSLEQGAYMVCLMQAYQPEGADDLEALRLAGAMNWLLGRPQRSRDLAEQILALAGTRDSRKRIAWANYADLFHRTQGPIDALVGLCCAGLNGAPMTPADLYQESYTLLRITRDLHQFDIAKSILPRCRELCEMQDLGRRGQDRLDGIELTLDVFQAPNLDAAGLLALVERTRVNCERTLESGDESHASASQFLQMAGAAERAGLQITPEATALREKLLRELGPELAPMLKVLSDAAPKPSEVLWLHNRIGAARHSEDTAADQTAVVVAAHRLLQAQEQEISAADAAVAIEILSDKSIEIPAAFQPLTEGWPAQAMAEYSQQGLAVVMLAFDSSDELCAVIADEGEFVVFRPEVEESEFRQRFDRWTSTYPLRYGLIDREEGTGEFYESMQSLNIPLPNADRVLVVAQPRLQQIPFNLVLVNGDLAGLSKAIGQAPSLTWLQSARNRPPKASSRRHAWISCAPDSAAYTTLDMIFARLAPVFEAHGISVDTTGRIPSDLHDSRLAIVSAHGQLSVENRFLHRITDEEELAESPRALARALADVDLVILFVCSGGRVDSHPMANTTVSLPKMLVDRGCRTVIASPWPLAAAVPGNWLEKFLERWEAGDTVLDANFAANKYVEQRLGLEPGLCLAMTVYGDPLLTNA